MANADSNFYGVVRNIPITFHSSDLRNYFSQLVEENAFSCFHFKHRPEVLATNASEDTKKNWRSCVCVVKFSSYAFRDRCIAMYDGTNWVDKEGNYMREKCKVSRFSISCGEQAGFQAYCTQGERKYNRRHAKSEDISSADLLLMSELNPPRNIMPNGNVGTSVKIFQGFIKQCKLPAKIIKKLGLVFPGNWSNRRFGNVSFSYNDSEVGPSFSRVPIQTASGRDISSLEEDQVSSANLSNKLRNDNEDEDIEAKLRKESGREESDDDTCEEWERHEALHEDVTSQGRTKERLFEEDIELKWEKGGSGLVFYTDAQYWAEENKDFDEETTDDWDVDMSEYYGGDGDRDAKDFIKIRKEERLRTGKKILWKQHRNNETSSNSKVGKFEQHTKGVGRKIMKKMGWEDGKTLGSGRKPGLEEPLEAEGQSSRVKRGLGYHGEKIKPVSNEDVGSEYIPKLMKSGPPDIKAATSSSSKSSTAPRAGDPSSFPEQKSVEPLASHSYNFPQFRSNLSSPFREYKDRTSSERKRAVPGADGIVITTKYDQPLDIDEDSGILRSQFSTSIKRRRVPEESEPKEREGPVIKPIKFGSKLVDRRLKPKSSDPEEVSSSPSSTLAYRPTIGTSVKFVRSVDPSNHVMNKVS